MPKAERTSTITLSDPSGICRFEAVRLTDEQTAEILGITVDELRAVASAPLGTITVTGIDSAAGVLRFDGDPKTPFQGPVGARRRRRMVTR
jgi:hypothetical protein